VILEPEDTMPTPYRLSDSAPAYALLILIAAFVLFVAAGVWVLL
jgi:hypothetical protein